MNQMEWGFIYALLLTILFLGYVKLRWWGEKHG